MTKPSKDNENRKALFKGGFSPRPENVINPMVEETRGVGPGHPLDHGPSAPIPGSFGYIERPDDVTNPMSEAASPPENSPSNDPSGGSDD